MAGKSTLTADAAEQAALRALSKSEQRGEADRAWAILLTLEGRRAEEIAATLRIHPSMDRPRSARQKCGVFSKSRSCAAIHSAWHRGAYGRRPR